MRFARLGWLVTVLAILVGLAVAEPAAAVAPPGVRCGDSGTPAVIALQDSHVYVDSASTALLFAGYAGYSVRAGSTARSHLWLGYSDFAGGVLDLAAGQAASTTLPDLASGGSTAPYALLTATATAVPQTHTVTGYDGPPGAAPPCAAARSPTPTWSTPSRRWPTTSRR